MIFADLDFARRLERVEAFGGVRFVEARERLSPETGARWVEVSGAHAVFDGPDSPITQTFGLGLFEEPAPDQLDELEAFFREHGAPVCHEVSPLAGVGVADVLCQRGYRPVEFTSVMYKPMASGVDSDAPFGARVVARLIADGEKELWPEVSARGWAEHPEWIDFLRDFGRVVASSEGSLCLLAELDGRPVAAGVLRCHEGVAYFGGACTIPEARRLGAQRALIEARMRIAAGEGCDLAMMCAQPGSTSQRNAERHGYRIAYTRTKWRLRDSTEDSLD